MDGVLQFIVTNLPLILCLLVGVALLVLEVFVPGFGLPGISGLAVTLIALALAGISISVSVKSAATGKLSKSALILNGTTPAVDHEDTESLLGRQGTTLTVLNPVGIAEFDGVRLNVVSEGTYLAKGAKVQVTKVEGAKIIVREING